MRKNIRRKAVLVPAAFFFLAASCPASSTDALKPAKTKFQITDPEKITIAENIGRVKEIFKGNDGRLVINIQDAHCNFEAQTNISQILDGLVKNGLSLVALEGAEGEIDTSLFTEFPDKEIRKEVAVYFMKKGKINGAEYFAIISENPPQLYGVETKEYYLTNLSTFINTLEGRKKVKAACVSVRATLDKLKIHIYSKELGKLDEMAIANKEGKLDFLDYCKYLKETADSKNLSLEKFPNLQLLYETINIEKTLNFNKIEDKRRLNLYSNYLLIYEKIDNAALMKEILALEDEVKAGLFTNNDQRALDGLSRNIRVLETMLDISMPKEDMEYYQRNKELFRSQAFIGFIKEKAARYGISTDYDPNFALVNKYLPDLENFYRIADTRDEAIIENTLRKMEEEDINAAALIIGDYHTEGIAGRLRSRGISYVVISPRITKQDRDNPYLEVLSNE